MSEPPAHDPLSQPERLAALAETGLLDALPQASLDRYTRIAAMCIGAPVALVSLVDPTRQFFSSMVGVPEPWASRRETPLSHSFCRIVVTTGEPLTVHDATHDARVAGNLAIPELGVVAYAGRPIRTSDSHVLGSFCVIDTQPREWTERELNLLDELCGAVIAEVELRRKATRYAASERELAAANAFLANSVESSSLLSRQALHDVRTPLQVVMMGVECLRMHAGIADYPELSSMLGRVARNAQHASSLIAGMVGSTPPPANTEVPPVTSNLATIVQQVTTDLSTADLPISLRGPLDLVLLVPLAATELRRCVENLLSNAKRFARQRIAVSLEAFEGQARISVDDDGAGLPSSEAYRDVWKRDVRFHIAEGLSGSGLGLSIVKEIVENAGGSVEALPSPWGGARFTIALPVKPAR